MRLTTICLTLLACVSALGDRTVASRDIDGASDGVNALAAGIGRVGTNTQSLDDIVEALQYEPAGTTRVVTAPSGDVRYTFVKYEDSISSTREFLSDNAELTNSQRLARGLKPRRPSRLYVGPNGRLARRGKHHHDTPSPNTCYYPYPSLEIHFETIKCSRKTSCTQGSIDIIKCIDNVLIQTCLLFEISTTGSYSASFSKRSGSNVGTCMIMGSCCPKKKNT